MVEVAYKIAVIAVIIVAIVAFIVSLVALFDNFAPEPIQQAVSSFVATAGGYIAWGRGLVNYFMYPGTEFLIDIVLALSIFSKPLLWLSKLSVKILSMLS